jgi:UDP-N-acetyl-D-mannosaminuronate dehydrogenase
LGGRINDYMPKHVVEIAVKALYGVGKAIKKTFHKSFIKNCPSGGVCFYAFPYVMNSRVLIMGLTYKENVARRLCRQ